MEILFTHKNHYLWREFIFSELPVANDTAFPSKPFCLASCVIACDCLLAYLPVFSLSLFYAVWWLFFFWLLNCTQFPNFCKLIINSLKLESTFYLLSNILEYLQPKNLWTECISMFSTWERLEWSKHSNYHWLQGQLSNLKEMHIIKFPLTKAGVGWVGYRQHQRWTVNTLCSYVGLTSWVLHPGV